MELRIGVLSDIHGNLEALNVALEALHQEGIREMVCCGDIVGYGPNPNECIELLKQRRIRCVQGNHDAAALGRADTARLNKAARRAIAWTQKRLSRETRSFLEGWPTVDRVEVEGLSISLVHGSPADPLWGYILRRRDAYLGFRLSEGKPFLQLFGHTHLPGLFVLEGEEVRREAIQGEHSLSLEEDKRYLLNPGSVGQPRDGDWRASLCLLEFEDPGSCHIRFRRLEYNVEKARQKILRAALPSELGTRLLSGI